jgi:hypothetical protein
VRDTLHLGGGSAAADKAKKTAGEGEDNLKKVRNPYVLTILYRDQSMKCEMRNAYNVENKRKNTRKRGGGRHV